MSLEQECSDLASWLPVLSVLLAEHDALALAGRGKPGSAPPWNAAVAWAYLDIHAGARILEQDLRNAVTGSRQPRGGSDANTIKALDAISKLAEAAPSELAAQAARHLDAWLSVIFQLPAVDLEQPPRRLQAPCPRPGCGRPMLRYYPNVGVRPYKRPELACLGCMVRAEVWDGPVSGEPIIRWADGIIT